MANNRLLLVDTETNENIVLLKSFGGGWKFEHTIKELEGWLDLRDGDASYGNCDTGSSTLMLMSEPLTAGCPK